MTATPILTTERLCLRAPHAADTDAILAFLGSDRADFYGGPMDLGTAWHKFSAYVGQWTLAGYGLFAVTLKDTNETIGLAGPHHPAHFPEPEMSWLIADARFEGHGYATEACRAVLDHYLTGQGWASLVSYIDRANHPSRALAQRLGATKEETGSVPIPNCDAYRHTAMGSPARLKQK